ncbi:MAG: hypothetical protein HGA19_04040 [Oscillochloris sp.]|nr:hypothetical protein [Oscillochloris sp.]
MPSGLGEATQMIGPIAPALMCWICFIVTVIALALTFWWTNITAFARNIRDRQREPAAGSVVKRSDR